MVRIWLCCAIVLLALVGASSALDRGGEMTLLEKVEDYVVEREKEFDQIPNDRKLKLEKLAEFVSEQRADGKTTKLTFICTHNSRRSHLSQIWAAVAASRYGIGGVETYSGGTEATAFNPRAVAALQRAGLDIVKADAADNPHYKVAYSKDAEPLVCFSKVYSELPNPSEDFCAVMTCSDADTNCPVVSGSSMRLAIPYEDPKVADNTAQEASKYDERSAQIAREMLYVFSHVK